MSLIGFQRVARIKAVHTACRKQQIDTETRHALQLQLTGKASLEDMSLAEISKVLDHLNRDRPDPGEWLFVFKMPQDRQRHAKKIYRLAQRVGAIMEKSVPVASRAYIEGIVKKMNGGVTQPLPFCDAEQLHKVVQALEVYLQRKGG